ncbi:FtsX-like permease family protein, partial [Paenibacillus sp. KS1]|uniref:FtsX-like permease family protein n=2 Tax=unclassified Paenibacillus TaxID=185978 RepID=UPI001C2F7996
IDQIKKQNSTLIFISISLGIILTCLSMIGFIGIIFMSIKKRLTDLAILYIHGSSISKLLLSLFFEFTCQLIIASSISYFISYLLTHLINDTPISLLTFGISSSLFFIIGIIITFFIRNKLSRTELIRSIKEVY